MLAEELAGQFVLNGEREASSKQMIGKRVVATGKFHEVAEEGWELTVGDIAEMFQEAAESLAGLEGASFWVGLFGELSRVGEGKFANPSLKQENGGIEVGMLLGVQCDSVLEGVHDWEPTRGGIEEHRF